MRAKKEQYSGEKLREILAKEGKEAAREYLIKGGHAIVRAERVMPKGQDAAGPQSTEPGQLVAAHDIWLQELLTTKTIEDAAFEHPKE